MKKIKEAGNNVMLSDVFSSRKRIAYEYDFGDGWIHTLELCRVIEDCREPYPLRCLISLRSHNGYVTNADIPNREKAADH